MNIAFQRIRAIVITDFRLRFRRLSTAVLFLLLCLTAYSLVPDPSNGTTLMAVNGQRVLYNSTVIALVTSVLGSVLLTLTGFYLVSHSLQREITARTGFVVAATPVCNIEYLAGKFLGNAVLLGSIGVGFMLAIMVMHLLRAEAPLEPLVYLSIYLWILLPTVTFVSAIALVFETSPWLSGRLGDVIYFFVWAVLLSVPAALLASGRALDGWQLIDTTGLSYVIDEITRQTQGKEVSLGAVPFDRGKPTLEMTAVGWSQGAILARLAASLLALPLLGLALAAFARFDPTRIKLSERSSTINPLAWLNGLVKPLARVLEPLYALAAIAGLPGWLRLVLCDALLTLSLSPLILIMVVGFAVANSLLPIETVHSAILPLIFVALVPVLAGIPTRERQAGLTALLLSTPAARSHFAGWKYGSLLVVTLCFTAIPLLRLVWVQPSAGFSLMTGSLFVAAVALAGGMLSGSPKTFVLIFLLFLYLVLNGGQSATLDFAGWYGKATPAVQGGYAAIAAVLVAVCHLKHRWDLHRIY